MAIAFFLVFGVPLLFILASVLSESPGEREREIKSMTRCTEVADMVVKAHGGRRDLWRASYDKCIEQEKDDAKE